MSQNARAPESVPALQERRATWGAAAWLGFGVVAAAVALFGSTGSAPEARSVSVAHKPVAYAWPEITPSVVGAPAASDTLAPTP